jgi:hypothetical protein
MRIQNTGVVDPDLLNQDLKQSFLLNLMSYNTVFLLFHQIFHRYFYCWYTAIGMLNIATAIVAASIKIFNTILQQFFPPLPGMRVTERRDNWGNFVG